MCRDHEALAKFYADAFGSVVVPEVASPIFVALDAGGVALGFHADAAFDLLAFPSAAANLTGNHITFDLATATEVDASVSRLRAARRDRREGSVRHLLLGARRWSTRIRRGTCSGSRTRRPHSRSGRRGTIADREPRFGARRSEGTGLHEGDRREVDP